MTLSLYGRSWYTTASEQNLQGWYRPTIGNGCRTERHKDFL